MTWQVRPGALPADDLLVVDDYLDADECALVTSDLEHTLWRGSEVVRTTRGAPESVRSDERTSLSATQRWFSDALNARLSKIGRASCREECPV